MSNILKKVCSAQKQYCAEHADSMESGNVEERNRHYRSLKMQAAGGCLQFRCCCCPYFVIM